MYILLFIVYIIALYSIKIYTNIYVVRRAIYWWFDNKNTSRNSQRISEQEEIRCGEKGTVMNL